CRVRALQHRCERAALRRQQRPKSRRELLRRVELPERLHLLRPEVRELLDPDTPLGALRVRDLRGERVDARHEDLVLEVVEVLADAVRLRQEVLPLLRRALPAAADGEQRERRGRGEKPQETPSHRPASVREGICFHVTRPTNQRTAGASYTSRAHPRGRQTCASEKRSTGSRIRGRRRKRSNG